jgi:ABC-type microcin C transport system permease subunit YejE
MHRKPANNWLNLLLAMIMVLGPWTVFADSARGDGCCTTAMESVAAGQHGGCEKDHAQDAPCVDHCCPAAHCATAVFLPSNIDIAFSSHGKGSRNNNCRFWGVETPVRQGAERGA